MQRIPSPFPMEMPECLLKYPTVKIKLIAFFLLLLILIFDLIAFDCGGSLARALAAFILYVIEIEHVRFMYATHRRYWIRRAVCG